MTATSKKKSLENKHGIMEGESLEKIHTGPSVTSCLL